MIMLIRILLPCCRAIRSESNLRLLHSDTAALDNLFNLI